VPTAWVGVSHASRFTPSVRYAGTFPLKGKDLLPEPGSKSSPLMGEGDHGEAMVEWVGRGV